MPWIRGRIRVLALRRSDAPVPSIAAMMRCPFPSVSAALLVADCGSAGSRAPGNDETDRVPRVVSDAIAWPRQQSAMDYARAAAGTTAGQDGRLTVVGSAARKMQPPWISRPCRRTDRALPSNRPRNEIPNRAERVLRTELHRLPTAPQEAQLETDLVAALTADSHTAQPPDVDAAVDGTDIGVSVRGDDECLLGARIAGMVEVWRPSAVQAAAGRADLSPQDRSGWMGTRRAALTPASAVVVDDERKSVGFGA